MSTIVTSLPDDVTASPRLAVVAAAFSVASFDAMVLYVAFGIVELTLTKQTVYERKES